MTQKQKYMLKKKPIVYNFGAGPAMMPLPVMQQVHDEWFDWEQLGMSIVEVGHRTPQFMALMATAETNLRELLAIPQDYHILFLGGAARTQFATVPLNILSKTQQAGYWVTGLWSELAFAEAKRLRRAYCIANSTKSGYTTIPEPSAWQLQDNTGYVYYTTNETVHGIRFAEVPRVPGSIPLVADMTSSFLSEPLNIEDFGLIFAGAQKNIAPAGLTIVIIHKQLLEIVPEAPIPTMLDYRIQVANQSLYATPPTFNCYMAAKMFEWVKAEGGVAALHQRNIQKAARLYNYIDASSFYSCAIDKRYRSLMNVCFKITKPGLEALFVEQAHAAGLRALKGHKQVGGLRASLYNAMPMAGVDALLNFMADFEEAQQ